MRIVDIQTVFFEVSSVKLSGFNAQLWSLCNNGNMVLKTKTESAIISQVTSTNGEKYDSRFCAILKVDFVFTINQNNVRRLLFLMFCTKY